MLNKSRKIEPWNREVSFWNGGLIVSKGVGEDGVFYRNPILQEVKPFSEALGEDLGPRTYKFLEWAFEAVLDPSLWASCPEPEVKAALKKLPDGRWAHQTVWMDEQGLPCNWSGSGVQDRFQIGLEETAFFLHLFNWARGVRRCDNGPPRLMLSQAARNRAETEDLSWPADFEDTGWKGRGIGRCAANFSRTIRFSRVLTPSEAEFFEKKFRAEERSPGWGTTITTEDRQTFLLTSFTDSSD